MLALSWQAASGPLPPRGPGAADVPGGQRPDRCEGSVAPLDCIREVHWAPSTTPATMRPHDRHRRSFRLALSSRPCRWYRRRSRLRRRWPVGCGCRGRRLSRASGASGDAATSEPTGCRSCQLPGACPARRASPAARAAKPRSSWHRPRLGPAHGQSPPYWAALQQYRTAGRGARRCADWSHKVGVQPPLLFVVT